MAQFEKSNAVTRDLKALQAFMLSLEVGMWSGFKRKMEIAESFLQPLLTVSPPLRRPVYECMLTPSRCSDEPGSSLLLPTRRPWYHSTLIPQKPSR